MHIELNNLIKQLRIEHGYSQNDLAELMHCSPQHISRLEKGLREVTDELISSLSIVFNVDFYHLKSKLERFNSITDYTDYYFLRQAIEKQDIVVIEKKLAELDACPTRFNYGQPLLLKGYCHALLLSYKYKEYEKSIECCYTALNCTEEDLLSFNGKSLKFISYYSIVLLLLFNYYSVGKIDTALRIGEQVLKHFDELQKNNYFSFLNQEYMFKKAYINLLNNMGYLYLENKDYESAFNISIKSIKSCSNLNILKPLHSLYELKFECLYNLQRFEEASEAYLDFKSVCKICNEMIYFENKSLQYEELGYLSKLNI